MYIRLPAPQLRPIPDTEIVARYTAQPPRLPAELRRQIEASWHGAPVQLYAFADLDHALRLTQVWVALGPGQLSVARPVERGDQWEIESVERAHIQAVREAPGLSASTRSEERRVGKEGRSRESAYGHK